MVQIFRIKIFEEKFGNNLKLKKHFSKQDKK